MKFFALFALFIALAANAEEPASGNPTVVAACSSDAHRQFDFWIGDWEVTSAGQPAGTNSIQPILGGCVLKENWQGSGVAGISGSSFNMYDQSTNKWHQTWVDSSGTLLLLDGGLVDGSMLLQGQRPARDGSGVVYHRISWTPNPDGSVRQLWEASKDEGSSWTVLFDGLYSRSSTAP